MVNTPQQLEASLKTLKPFLAEKFDIRKIGYFGSFAANEQNKDSDVDIVVELGSPLGWEFFDIEILLENALERKIDLFTTKSIKARLKEKILASTKFV